MRARTFPRRIRHSLCCLCTSRPVGCADENQSEWTALPAFSKSLKPLMPLIYFLFFSGRREECSESQCSLGDAVCWATTARLLQQRLNESPRSVDEKIIACRNETASFLLLCFGRTTCEDEMQKKHSVISQADIWSVNCVRHQRGLFVPLLKGMVQPKLSFHPIFFSAL